MDLVKVCPACGSVNRASSFICSICGTDISDVIAQEAEKRTCPNCGAPLSPEDIVCPACQLPPGSREVPSTLVLTTEDGLRLVIGTGQPVVLGRDGDVHPEFFTQFPTVSRKHLTIRFVDDHWECEDHSLNGTYLNGKLLPKNTPFTLRSGDTLQLARAVRFQVSIEEGERK